VWTGAHRDEFEERGFTRLERTFDDMTAAHMRTVAWQELGRRYGVHPPGTDAAWPPFVCGMKTTKRHRVFDAIGTATLAAAMDDLLGPDSWSWPKQWGLVMVTAPGDGTPWRLPHRTWHVDFPYTLPRRSLAGVKVFAFFGDVAPQGGGTLLVERSHQMTKAFVTELTHDERNEYRRVRDTFLRHDPWLRALSTPNDDPDRNERFLEHDAVVDGVPTRVVELSGRAGDVVITHPWVYHCAAPNAHTPPAVVRIQ